MTTEQMIDTFSRALTAELLKCLGPQLPAAARDELFVPVYTRVMIGFQSFDEFRGRSSTVVGRKVGDPDRIDVSACGRQLAIQIKSHLSGASP